MCCPRKSSRMRRRIDAVDRCHELAAGRREQADVGAERDEGRAGRDLVARILGVAGEHAGRLAGAADALDARSEEHTSELQSLMRISYAVFCLKKKTDIVDNSTLTIH